RKPERADAARQLEDEPRRCPAQEARDAAREAVAAEPAGHPALHRAAVVDVLDEVLPLLLEPEQLLRPADLQQLPRQHGVVGDDLPGWQRGEQPPPVTPTDRWAGSPPSRPPVTIHPCAISFADSASTS